MGSEINKVRMNQVLLLGNTSAGQKGCCTLPQLATLQQHTLCLPVAARLPLAATAATTGRECGGS